MAPTARFLPGQRCHGFCVFEGMKTRFVRPKTMPPFPIDLMARGRVYRSSKCSADAAQKRRARLHMLDARAVLARAVLNQFERIFEVSEMN